MLHGIIEDRVYNFIINNQDLVIIKPPQLYFIKENEIQIKDLFNYMEQYQYVENSNTIIKNIEKYLWENYIWNKIY